MKIEHDMRYFKLKPKAAELFKQYSRAAHEARNARIRFAEAFLVEHDVPDGVAEVGLYPHSFNAAFPRVVRQYAPKLFNKPDKYGYCQLKGTLKTTKQFEQNLNKIKIPKVCDYLPTLNVGQVWFMGDHVRQVVVGSYGSHIVLCGVPKNPPDQELYEVDFDMLEEMTLTEWAQLVAEVENNKIQT